MTALLPCDAISEVQTCATVDVQKRPATHTARASAAGVAEAPSAPRQPSPVTGLSDKQRAALAEELGYRQIGKDLPEDITLQRVISSLPKDVRPRVLLDTRI